MDILLPFKILSFLFTIFLLAFSWKKIHSRFAYWLFALTICYFYLAAALFFPEGEINDWMKHIPFYMGQLFFYLFLKRIILEDAKNQETKQRETIAAPVGWFYFVTQQGIQHIITLPFLFLTVALIRVEFSFIQSKEFRSILNMFMIAGFFLTMIHVGEFIVETQGLLPFMEGDPIEIVEFLWFYAGLATFSIAIQKLYQYKRTLALPS